MLWALWVVDLLLDLSSESSDAYLLCLLLLLYLLHDSLWVNLCWSLSRESFLSLVLQHILKWFLFRHLRHFLPHAGHSLGGCDVLHLLHILFWVPSKLALWPLPFLYLKELISSMAVAIAAPPFDLYLLKSFYHHLKILGMLEEALVHHVLSPLL